MVTSGTSPFTTPVKTPAIVSTDITYNGVVLKSTTTRKFQLGAFTDTVTPSYCTNLAGKALFEFRNQAVEPFDHKWSLTLASVNISSDQSFFASNNKIMTMLYILRTRLHSFCMHSVFDIFPVDTTTGTIDTTASPIDLFEKACIITEAQVRMSNQIYAENTDDKLHPRNLAWTQDLMLGCCDPDLRGDLEHRLITIPDNEQGGPLVLHMILYQLMTTTHESARAIISRLQNLSVTDYPGENITNFCATFTNVLMHLNISGHVPSDIGNIFFIGLHTCTVSKFTSLLETLENTEDSVINNFYGLRDKMVQKYNNLLLTEKWLPTSKPTSSFNQTTTVSDTRRSPSSTTSASGGPTIDCTPPAPNTPNIRAHPTKSNRQEWWCTTCNRWGNHSTDRHGKFKE
ncbi:hypothetical protein ACA910_008429 [Epithemia clementina (nom. ined.)]